MITCFRTCEHRTCSPYMTILSQVFQVIQIKPRKLRATAPLDHAQEIVQARLWRGQEKQRNQQGHRTNRRVRSTNNFIRSTTNPVFRLHGLSLSLPPNCPNRTRRKAAPVKTDTDLHSMFMTIRTHDSCLVRHALCLCHGPNAEHTQCVTHVPLLCVMLD